MINDAKMKRYSWTAVVVMALMLSAIGCRRSSDRIFPFGWERSGEPFDSLMAALEWKFIGGVSPDSMAGDLARLHSLADSDGRSVMKARALYWEARADMRAGDYGRSMELFDSALVMALADSARYPYDVARIRWNMEPDYTPLTVDYYEKLRGDIDFFEREGDYPLAAGRCMELAMMFTDLGAVSESWPLLDKADSLFTLSGMEMNVMKNMMNRAKNYDLEGRHAEGEAALRSIVDEPLMVADPPARAVALNNLYSLYGDTAALKELCVLADSVEYLREFRSVYDAYRAEELAKAGCMDSALTYIRMAGDCLSDMSDPMFVRDYYKSRAFVMKAAGRTDSAYQALKDYSAMTDTMYMERQTGEVMNAELLSRIGERRLAAENDRRRATVLLFSLVIAVIVAGEVAFAVIYRKMQRQKLAEAKAALALEQSRRKVMALKLTMDENDRMVESVSAEIGNLSREGAISSEAAMKLEGVMRGHTGIKREQENFLTLFGEINPGYVPALRERWPNLSDAEVRMAVYIALGLDNKHIARLAGIRPESVKQARWRLRNKLGLNADASLDDVLKSML